MSAVAILTGAAGAIAWIACGGIERAEPATSSTTKIRGCRATDGDTIRCGGERVRLLAIDAPELPGHSRRGRTCAPGDPVASLSGLRRAMVGELRIERHGTDRYGRTLALVLSNGADLSCGQLRIGAAIYRRDWDEGGRVAAICLDVATQE